MNKTYRTYITQKQKDDWVKALRSGKYQQCKITLRGVSPNCYCALGLAYKVMSKKAWPSTTQEVYTYLKDRDIPIEEVWIRNDAQNYSFSNIADWVVANILAKGE